MIDIAWKVGAFLVVLGVLVVFHELGHYAVARLAGVKVLRFSVGFGRIVWSRRFGPDRTVSYLVAVREHAPEDGEFVRLSETGPLTLRTCDLVDQTCTDVTSIANTRGTPVLPH